jgi:MFS family permease
LRAQAFWFLAVSAAIGFMGMNAVTALVASYLDDEEASTGMIWVTTTFLPLASILGRLGLGWAGDIYSKKGVLTWSVILQTIGLGAFCYAPNTAAIALFLITFGIGYGGAIALRPAIQRDYFGRSAFGAIQGLLMGVVTLGGVIGPVVAGWVFDSGGDYQPAWIAFAIANFLSIPLVLAMRRPGTSKAPRQHR